MKRFLIWALAAVLLVSCTQETTVTLEPDVYSWTFGPEGGEFDVVIFTNGYWTATCDDPSLSFSPASGNFTAPIHVVVAENTEHFTKSMRISLNTEIDEKTMTGKVVVTQQCRPFILCADPLKRIGPEGGAVRFSVNSSEPWTATVPDGAHAVARIDPAAGGHNNTEVAIYVPENTDRQERTYTVRLFLTGLPSEAVDLTVKQGAY